MKLKIRELRQQEQLTQKEVADKIYNVQRNVSNWENGTSEPDCESLVKLANLFDVSLDELFNRDYDDNEYMALYQNNTSTIKKKVIKEIDKLNEDQLNGLYSFLKSLQLKQD